MFECRHRPLALPAPVEADLAARYAEPHRAYHTGAHIAEVLRWFDWVADETGWAAPNDVYVAIAFHDAIYDPLAKDNEARSADLARDTAGASQRAQDLILLTARHGALTVGDVAHDADAAHFLDSDTAILGAAPAAFDAYDAAVAFEYQVVPPAAFQAGRGHFLRTMLARERIFLSELFHAKLDAAARENISRALARY